MLRFIHNLLGIKAKTNRKSGPRHSQRRALSLEGLESRNLMAADLRASAFTHEFQAVAPKSVTIAIENHDLVIRGTDGPDDVKVSYQDGKFVVKVTTLVNGRGVSTSSNWRPTGGDVLFHGFKGNDKFTTAMSAGNYLRVNADGGEGNDTLNGSWGKDKLKAGNGDDTLYGHGSHDVLDAGFGADKIFGGDGDDTIATGYDYSTNYAEGGNGNDTITGGYGIDELLGGAGHDHLFGGAGHDRLNGGSGNDYLYGGADNDYLYGGSGEDHLYGDVGNDDLDGGAYNEKDYAYGGDGKDRFRADLDEDQWYASDYNPPGPGEWNVLMDLEPGETVYTSYNGPEAWK